MHFCFGGNIKQTVEETPPMRMGSMRVVVVFSSFFSFFSGAPGGLSPPEGRFPPPVPDMLPYKIHSVRQIIEQIIIIILFRTLTEAN